MIFVDDSDCDVGYEQAFGEYAEVTMKMLKRYGTQGMFTAIKHAAELLAEEEGRDSDWSSPAVNSVTQEWLDFAEQIELIRKLLASIW